MLTQSQVPAERVIGRMRSRPGLRVKGSASVFLRRRSMVYRIKARAAKGKTEKVTVGDKQGPSLPGTQFFSNPFGTFKLKQEQPASTQKVQQGTALLRGFGRGAAGRAKDDRTVFVAGATGRLGARVVRELLSVGYNVRAGARNVGKAKEAAKIASEYGVLSSDQLRRLNVVEFDLTRQDSVAAAIGNAAKVVCCVGASEALSFNAPRQIDGEGTIGLIQTASQSGVKQFVLCSSLGTGKIGFPAGVLNLFGGVLIFKKKAEEALEKSGMIYTIIRPGGMERPTDDFKNTHNIRLAPRDTWFGGQVSRLQVAEVVAAACATPQLSENKVFEVVAETTAPEVELAGLFAQIPSDITREDQLERVAVDQERQERIAAAEQEAQSELQKAQSTFAAAQRALEEAKEEVQDANEAIAELKADERQVKSEVSQILREGRSAETSVQKAQAALKKASLQEAAAKAVLEAARKAASSGELLSPAERRKVEQNVLSPPPPSAQGVEARTSESPLQLPFWRKAPQVQQAVDAAQGVEDSVEEQGRGIEEKSQRFGSFLKAFLPPAEDTTSGEKSSGDRTGQLQVTPEEPTVKLAQDRVAQSKKAQEAQRRQEGRAKAESEAAAARQEREAKAQQAVESSRRQKEEAALKTNQQKEAATSDRQRKEEESKGAKQTREEGQQQWREKIRRQNEEATAIAKAARENAAEKRKKEAEELAERRRRSQVAAEAEARSEVDALARIRADKEEALAAKASKAKAPKPVTAAAAIQAASPAPAKPATSAKPAAASKSAAPAKPAAASKPAAPKAAAPPPPAAKAEPKKAAASAAAPAKTAEAKKSSSDSAPPPKPAVVPPKAQAASSGSKGATSNKEDARQWIANWRAKQGAQASPGSKNGSTKGSKLKAQGNNTGKAQGGGPNSFASNLHDRK